MRMRHHIIFGAVLLAVFVLPAPKAAAQRHLLTLEECKELCSDNDYRIRNAGLDVLAARARKQEALAEYFPSVSATAMAFHALNPFIDIGITDIIGKSEAAWNISNYWDEFSQQNGLPSRYRALEYGYSASLSLTQPVFAGGRIVTGNRLAALGDEAATLQKEIAERDSDMEIEEKYWQVVSLQEKRLTLAGARELLDSLEKDVLSACSAGLMTEADLLQVRMKSSELKSAESKLRGGLRLAKMDLLNLVSFPYASVSAAADSARPFIDDIEMADSLGDFLSPDNYYMEEESLASNMEESRLLELRGRAKALEKKMAVGEALPTVGLGAMYGYGKTLGDGRSNGALYAVVKIPLTDWGKASKKIRRCEYEIMKAENEKAYLDAQLVLKARQMWLELNTSWEQIAIAEEAVECARTVYDHQKASFGAGMSTLSELLQTQNSLRQCEDALTDSRIAYRKALNSYLLAVR